MKEAGSRKLERGEGWMTVVVVVVVARGVKIVKIIGLELRLDLLRSQTNYSLGHATTGTTQCIKLGVNSRTFF